MSSKIRLYSTLTFNDIWEKAADFKTDFQDSPYAGCISSTTPDTVSLIYYLLYSRYGNSPMANDDVTQFKFKIYTVIFQYGPTWEKKLEIQKKLRELTDDDIRLGSKAVYNHAFNPSEAPGTGTLDELSFINDQNTTNYKKSKVEGYTALWEALSTDITEQFIKKFQYCFKAFVAPELPLLYDPEDIEDDDDE